MTPSIGTLTDRLNLGRYSGDPGVRFARRPERVSKSFARGRVLSDIAKWHAPRLPLRILTMPGVGWSFERSLIDAREHGRGKRHPRNTHITAIEQSTPVWTASLLNMPGRGLGMDMSLPCPEFASAAMRTFTISRFFKCSFEDLACSDYEYWFHAAWVDLCGPITVRRLEALGRFWERSLRSTLILTSLRARWTPEIADAVHSEGIAALLLRHLSNGMVMSEFEYMDGSPMHQITVRKRNW